MSVELGLKGRAETVVSQQNTASAVGSGAVEVFGTPFMIALMEGAAANAVLSALEPGQATVGTHINVSHDAATPIGMKVWAEAEVIEIDRKHLIFQVIAYDEKGVIGKGTHDRFIINTEKFLAKSQTK